MDTIRQELEWRDAEALRAEKFVWGADYGKDILVDLNRLAHAVGTGALHRDALRRAFVEITRLRKLIECNSIK